VLVARDAASNSFARVEMQAISYELSKAKVSGVESCVEGRRERERLIDCLLAC